MRDIPELLSLLKEPPDRVLGLAGIQHKLARRGPITYYNLEHCPVCRKEKAKFECAVFTVDNKNKMKCWHEHATYFDFLVAVTLMTQAEHMSLIDYFNNRKSRSTYEYVSSDAKAADIEHHRRYKFRLRNNDRARKYLENRGLTQETIEYFGLGLSGEVEKVVYVDALNYPVRLANGQFSKTYGKYNVPGVTTNPTSPNGWCKGEPQTYWADRLTSQDIIIVCEGVKDLWRTWQALQGTEIARQAVLISSTHGAAFPAEWYKEEFWSQWARVYFCFDNDEAGHKMALKLGLEIGRDSRRIEIPVKYGKDLTDFWQNGGELSELELLMDRARVAISDPALPQLGHSDDKPIPNIAVAYNPINGFLYYTKDAVLRTEKKDEKTGKVERNTEYSTVIIRSDRRKIGWRKATTDPTTPKDLWTFELTGNDDGDNPFADGTLISRPPRQSSSATWSMRSIKRFLNGVEKPKPLKRLLRNVSDYLRSKIWLPHDADYTLLALIVLTTYAQEIFDAVPLVLTTGEKGSGKTELLEALSYICCNAEIVGGGSAAAIARALDENRGTAILDDIEKVKSKAGQESFDEVMQFLKTSYKKASAVKKWSDSTRGFKTFNLYYYGVKILSNTAGVDTVLGSRMMQICTMQMPDHAKEEWAKRHLWEQGDVEALRDELHVWVMSNVAEIHKAYLAIKPQISEREEQLATPLKVFAKLAGDEGIEAELEKALSKQKVDRKGERTVEDILRDAAATLIQEGFVEIAITHIVNQIRSIVRESFGDDYGREFTNQIPLYAQPQWVGRELRRQNIIENPVSQQRISVQFGQRLRTNPFSPQFLQQVHDEMKKQGYPIPANKEPNSFCQKCGTCDYSVSCTILDQTKGKVHVKKEGISR